MFDIMATQEVHFDLVVRIVRTNIGEPHGDLAENNALEVKVQGKRRRKAVVGEEVSRCVGKIFTIVIVELTR